MQTPVAGGEQHKYGRQYAGADEGEFDFSVHRPYTAGMATSLKVWYAIVVCLVLIAVAVTLRAGGASKRDKLVESPASRDEIDANSILAQYGQKGLALWQAYKYKCTAPECHHNDIVDTTYALGLSDAQWCPETALSSPGNCWTCGWSDGKAQCQALNRVAKKMVADGVLKFNPVPAGLQ